MAYLPNLIFLILLAAGVGFFARNLKRIIRNIKLGKEVNRSNQPKLRFKNMLRVAFGQSKMVSRPISGLLHLVVYIGFVIINIEVLEIVLDGLLGTHRLFAFLGPIYDVLIGTFEIFAALVVVAVAFFWLRRNALKLKR